MKVKAGEYLYEGYVIKRIGYYPPEKRIVWEGINITTRDTDFHGFTKKEVIKRINKSKNIL